MSSPFTNVAGTMIAVTTQNGTVVGGACASGDLLFLIVGKRASSNFTFPAAFTKAQEIAQTGVTSGMASAIAWKWAAAADSGASFVCSTSGAGNLLHAFAIAVSGVTSTATPVNALITEVRSSNINRCGSLRAIGDALELCAAVGFDNVAITAAGFTGNGFTLANSANTTVGSDGHMTLWKRAFSNTDSGNWFLPNSSAGTAPRHFYTFQLLGPPYTPSTYTYTLNDYVTPYDSGERVNETVIRATERVAVEDTKTSFRRFARVLADSGALQVIDAALVRRAMRRLVGDAVDLLDSYIKDVVVGGPGPQIYTLTRTDNIALNDALLHAWYSVRLLGEGVTATDQALISRRLGRAVMDVIAVTDAAFHAAVRGRMVADTVMPADQITRAMSLSRAPSDSVVITESMLTQRTLTRALSNVVAVYDSGERAAEIVTIATEAIRATDSASFSRTLNRVLTDSGLLSLLDSFTENVVLGGTGGTVYTMTRTDSAVLTDALLGTIRYIRVLGDAITLVDEKRLIGILQLVISDVVLAVDSAVKFSRLSRMLSEGTLLEVLDSGGVLRLLHVMAEDELAVVDTSLARRILQRLAPADSVTLSDGLLVTRLLHRALTDALSVTDSALKTIIAGGGISIKVAEDVITISDSLQRIWMRRRVVGDDITVSDFSITWIAGGPVIRIATDALAASDTLLRMTIRNRQMQDVVATLLDQQVKGVVKWRLLQDVMTPEDFSLKLLIRVALLADELVVTDQGLLTGKVSVRALSDVLESTDGFTKIFFDALAGLIDVRILIGAERPQTKLGQFNPVVIGTMAGPVLGGYN